MADYYRHFGVQNRFCVNGIASVLKAWRMVQQTVAEQKNLIFARWVSGPRPKTSEPIQSDFAQRIRLKTIAWQAWALFWPGLPDGKEDMV